MNRRKPFCIIPARGGSKRFPRKNITPLQGKPLLAWTIGPAMESGLFDAIWVSSEDEEILAVAESCGASPLRRAPALGGDKVALEPVCREAVDLVRSQDPDLTDLYLMLPTSPFRTVANIRASWRAFIESGADALMSIIPYPHPPQWAMTLREDRRLAPHDWDGYYTERQDLRPLYRHDGAYFISNIDRFLETGLLMGPETVAFPTGGMESVDIDEPMDLAIFICAIGGC